MKHYFITILAITLAGSLTSCNGSDEGTSSSSDKPASGAYDSRIIGTWKYVGDSSYMKIEDSGTISYYSDLSSGALRVGKWNAPSKDLIEVRFDWLEDAKGKSPEEADRIRKAIEKRPKDRYSTEKFSAVIGDSDDMLLMGSSGGSGRVSPWERVKDGTLKKPEN